VYGECLCVVTGGSLWVNSSLLLTCVGSSSDVGSCDVWSVVRLAFLLPVSGSVAPDVRVVLVRRCWRIEN
jgi:hypothetical protein